MDENETPQPGYAPKKDPLEGRPARYLKVDEIYNIQMNQAAVTPWGIGTVKNVGQCPVVGLEYFPAAYVVGQFGTWAEWFIIDPFHVGKVKRYIRTYGKDWEKPEPEYCWPSTEPGNAPDFHKKFNAGHIIYGYFWSNGFRRPPRNI